MTACLQRRGFLVAFLLFSFCCPCLAAWPESEDDGGSFEKRPVVWQIVFPLFQVEILARKEQCSDAAVVQMIKKNKIKPQWKMGRTSETVQ